MAVNGLPLPTFEDGSEVESFLERLDCYFTVGNVRNDRRVPMLLMGLSPSQYQTLKDLVAPEVPSDMTLDVLSDRLRHHYGRPRNQRLERNQFRSVNRLNGESVNDFEVRIRKAARYCGFGDRLDENLIDQFISGIRHAVMSRKLIEGAINTLMDAVVIANTVTLMEEDSVGIRQTPLIARVQDRRDTKDARSRNKTKDARSRDKDVVCFRCLRSGHKSNDSSCPALGKICKTCGKEGHFAGSKYCRKKKQSSTAHAVSSTVSSTREESEGVDFGSTFTVGGKMSNCVPRCQVNFRGKAVSFLVDSGAVSNIVDRDTYTEICGDVILEAPDKDLFAFGQSVPLKLLGQFVTDVSVSEHIVSAKFYVYDGKACNLLSLNTARQLGVLVLKNLQCNVNNLESVVRAQYPECFTGVGKLKDVQVKLHVNPDCDPVAQPVRRLPFSYRKKVEKALETLLSDDIIEPVHGVGSTWVSPLVVVPKEGDEVRLCVDMRMANKAIVRERYPVPTMQEMLVALNGAQVFSKLDLKQGFFQCELEPDSRVITTFVSHVGLFRMKRLCMGVSSAPEVFQYTIQKVLNGIEGALNLADDIIVFGKDVIEHRNRLMKVMSRLSECGLTLNEAKCKFGVSSMKFLGHVLSSEGVSPDPEKVESILCARAPQGVSELKGFLGLVQFVGRYLPDLATIAAPLWSLTKKSVVFRWTKGHQDAFDRIKKLMGSSETLAYYDQDAITTLVADASPAGLGAVLIQKHGGVSKVVAYGHRRLSEIESRYSQIEREALALIWACEHFKMYLLGIHFTLVTDHKPLIGIFGNARSKPTPRLERWSFRLTPFCFDLEYRPGCSNVADPMSRLSVSGGYASSPVVDEGFVAMVAGEAVPCAMTWAEIQESSKSCVEAEIVRKALQSNDWDSCSITVKSVRGELSECDGVILRGNRIFIPKSLRHRVLSLAHEGHQGIVKTKHRLRQKVWWPGLDKEAEALCRQCLSCQLVSSGDPPTPIVPTKMPEGPWKFCAIDLLGPLPDGRTVVVLIDYFSRFFETSFLRSTKSEKVVSFLEDIFSRYGYPQLLRSDNGPQFISGEFQCYLKQCGIEWISTTPLWPQANGEVERMNRTILKALKIAKTEGRDLEKALREFSMAYRATQHSGTGMSPFALMFGREMRTKLPMMDDGVFRSADEVKDCESRYKQKMKEYADKGTKESPVQIGDTVVMRNENRGKLDSTFSPEEHRVTGRQGSDLICISPSGNTVRRNVSFAKKLRTPESSLVDTSITSEPGPMAPQSDTSQQREVTPIGSRVRKPPGRFQDFQMH